MDFTAREIFILFGGGEIFIGMFIWLGVMLHQRAKIVVFDFRAEGSMRPLVGARPVGAGLARDGR